MVNLAKALVGLAAVAFAMAVLTNSYLGDFFTSPEGYSRASNNLSLLAIALGLLFGAGRSGSRP